jgi:hypothetical protein
MGLAGADGQAQDNSRAVGRIMVVFPRNVRWSTTRFVESIIAFCLERNR